jgi:RHS repeat-associated protein
MTENPDSVSLVRKYFYDDDGNVECVTKNTSSTVADCPDAFGAPVSANLEERFGWHYQNRLKRYDRYGTGAGSATYEYDPFDRLVLENEEHTGQPDRQTIFTYQGLTSLVSSETSGTQQKTYTYDASEQLVAMTRSPSNEFAYSGNVHTDVSLLLNLTDNGRVYASYGYKAYGAKEDGLTRFDTDAVNPVNPYRFNATRYDPGSTTLAMGVRRYNTDLGRFIQQDLLTDSSDDLDLTTETITQDRYVYAAGNPVQYVETDGHFFEPLDDHWRRRWCGLRQGSRRRCPKLIYPFPKGYPRRFVGARTIRGAFHPTGGLKDAGIPPHTAIDFGAQAYGARRWPVLAVVTGKTRWLQGGRDPATGPNCEKRTFGFDFYLRDDVTRIDYYYAHLATRRVRNRGHVRVGEQVGTVADWNGRCGNIPNHLHLGATGPRKNIKAVYYAPQVPRRSR